MEISDFAGLLATIDLVTVLGAEPGSATVTQIGLYVRMLGGKIAALEQVAGRFSPAPAVNALSLPAPHIATAPTAIPGATTDPVDISLLLGSHFATAPTAIPGPASDPIDFSLLLGPCVATGPAALPAPIADPTSIVGPVAGPITCASAAEKGKGVAPLDKEPETGRPSKRQRCGSQKLGVLRDSAGKRVKPARLARLFSAFFYMPVDMVCTLYRRMCGRQLDCNGGSPQDLLHALTRMEGFKLYYVHDISMGVDKAIDWSFIQRSGPKFETMRHNVQRRLSATATPVPPIPSPLLYYHLAIMGCMRLELLTDDVLGDIFWKVTGQGLDSYCVATPNGLRRVLEHDACNLVRTWVSELRQFAYTNGRIKKTLDMAAKCLNVYTRRCNKKATSSASLDPEGAIALQMIEDNECGSQVLLGIRKHELKLLFAFLPYMVDEEDEDKKSYFKNVSDDLFDLV
ncbi:hypothetical protein FBU31_002028 [Coemansia sp. 'formosensis']|nr:hypothetical protein FBU31_002028 [Coemansia sp. 'formosensis']